MKRVCVVLSLSLTMLATVLRPVAFANSGTACGPTYPCPQTCEPSAAACGTSCGADLCCLGVGVLVVAAIAAGIIASSGSEHHKHVHSH